MKSVRELCETHKADHAKWLDYRLPPLPPVVHTIGGSVRDVKDVRRLRYEDWRRTISDQQALIRRICTTQCSSEVVVEVAPAAAAVTTVDLDAWGGAA